MTTFLTVAEVAQVLRKNYRSVLNELHRGNLLGAQIGGQWRIKPADLDAYVAARMNVQPTTEDAA